MDEDGIDAALADQFGEQDAVGNGLSSGAAPTAAQPTAAQPGASNRTSSARGKARVVDVDAEDHEDAHAAAGSNGGRPAYLNDGPATRVQADGLTLRDFVQRAAAKRNPNAHWRVAVGVGASSEMLGSVIVPRYAENKGDSDLGQLALPRPLPAPDRAPGCPELRPASADQPLRPRWPATSGLFST